MTKGSAPTFSAAYDGATNRQVGLSYDANGNVYASSYTIYDAENRMTNYGAGPTRTYGYDAFNRRVLVQEYSGPEDDLSAEEVTFYGPGGERMGVYRREISYDPYQVGGFGGGQAQVWFGGKLIRAGGQKVVQDRLGSVAVQGSERVRFWPYGEERGTTAQKRQKWATYWRDDTGLDYAMARYQQNGRFRSPDPYISSGGPGAPQSWNRYAYVQNDPVNWYDPGGLLEADPNGSGVSGGGIGFGFIYGTGPEGSYGSFGLVSGSGPPNNGQNGSGGGGGGSAQVDPLELAKATTAMQRRNAARAVANLGEGCQGVFNDPSRNIGTAALYQALGFNATDVRYFGAFGPEAGLTLSQAGVVDPVTGKPYAGDPTIGAYTPPLAAATAVTAGGTAIILTVNFYQQNAAGQSITLVHEMLHLTYGGESDVDIAARFGIGYAVAPGADRTTAASRAISDWLRSDCGRIR